MDWPIHYARSGVQQNSTETAPRSLKWGMDLHSYHFADAFERNAP